MQKKEHKTTDPPRESNGSLERKWLEPRLPFSFFSLPSPPLFVFPPPPLFVFPPLPCSFSLPLPSPFRFPHPSPPFSFFLTPPLPFSFFSPSLPPLFVFLPAPSLPFRNGGHADASVRMETMIDNMGDLTRRVPGLDGFQGMRVGEASHPGPSHVQPTADDSTEVVSALEFDMIQLDSDLDVSGSDTESCAADAPPAISHAPRDRRLSNVMRELGNRIGHVPVGSPVPRAIRQQSWSPLNVPLMWAAASGSDSKSVAMVATSGRNRRVTSAHQML